MSTPGHAPADFPDDRSERTTILQGRTSVDVQRFWDLSAHIAFPEIRSIVAEYINSTIPDPVNTQGLWTVAALSTTPQEGERRRLLTIECGGVETLHVTEVTHSDDSIELDLTIRTAVPEGRDDSELAVSNHSVVAAVISDGDRRVLSWSIDLGALLDDDSDVDLGVDDDTFDDLAYALNIGLLCGAERSHEHVHDQALADDLLAEVYRLASDSI